MKMTSLQDSSNDSNLFNDSSPKRGTKRNFRSIQPSSLPEQHTIKRAHKENYRNVFHKDDTVRSKQTPMKKLVPQTFTTDSSHDKVEPTKSSRPTMGGKTIGSIHKSDHEPMSCQELKLLSRRINPHEPLPSPHASPRKPPLPNIKKLGARSRPFTCEPCDKHYKTRNGLTYHLERCKHRQLAVNCICSNNVIKGTLIECTQCHNWLHMKCIKQDNVKEETYLCPRCLPNEEEETLESLFADDSFAAFMDEQTSGLWDSEFNSVDWYNTADIPSLLLSDNGIMDGCSTSELLSSSNMPSSPLSESDWMSFTNLNEEFNQ